jgi:uncharacterized OB-fold protein
MKMFKHGGYTSKPIDENMNEIPRRELKYKCAYCGSLFFDKYEKCPNCAGNEFIDLTIPDKSIKCPSFIYSLD